jgi:MFS family permease
MSGLGFVFFMEEVHSSAPSIIGWLVAARSIAYALGCLFLIPLVRRIIPRHSVAFSLFGMGATLLVIAFTPSVPMVLLFSILFGLVHSLFWPPLMGWLSHGSEGSTLGKNLSRFNMSFSIGMMIGPTIGGFLAETDAAMPMYISSIIFFFVMVLLLSASFLPVIKRDRYRDQGTAKVHGRSDASTLLRFPAWIGFFVSSSVSGVIMTVFPLYATAELAFDKGQVGILFFSRALFGMLTFLVFGQMSVWHFKGWQMTVGLGCLAATLAVMLFATSFPLYLVLLALVGIFVSSSYANSIFHGVSGSLNRSARMAIHEALLQGGLVVGSSVGGAVYEYYAMRTLLLCCIGFLILAMLIQIVIVYIHRRRAAGGRSAGKNRRIPRPCEIAKQRP